MAPSVHPAEPEDAAAIGEVFLRCFDDEYFQSLFPPNEHGRAYSTAAWGMFMTSKARGSQEGRVFVTRDDDGKVTGASLVWIIKPEDSGVWSWRERWPPANAGQQDELLDEFFRGMHHQHEATMGKKAHICRPLTEVIRNTFLMKCVDFELVVVDPSHHRKGHGKALVQHAANIADALGYDSYLDADEEVMALYTAEGYVARTEVENTSIMKPMVRHPRSPSEK